MGGDYGRRLKGEHAAIPRSLPCVFAVRDVRLGTVSAANGSLLRGSFPEDGSRPSTMRSRWPAGKGSVEKEIERCVFQIDGSDHRAHGLDRVRRGVLACRAGGHPDVEFLQWMDRWFPGAGGFPGGQSARHRASQPGDVINEDEGEATGERHPPAARRDNSQVVRVAGVVRPLPAHKGETVNQPPLEFSESIQQGGLYVSHVACAGATGPTRRAVRPRTPGSRSRPERRRRARGLRPGLTR